MLDGAGYLKEGRPACYRERCWSMNCRPAGAYPAWVSFMTCCGLWQLPTTYAGMMSPVLPHAVAPPGWYIVPGSNPARTAECPDGWFKESYDHSISCTKCGMNTYEEPDGFGGVVSSSTAGWRSNRTVQIEMLDPMFGVVTTRMAVRGSPDSCCECHSGLTWACSGVLACMQQVIVFAMQCDAYHCKW